MLFFFSFFDLMLMEIQDTETSCGSLEEKISYSKWKNTVKEKCDNVLPFALKYMHIYLNATSLIWQ